MSCISRSTTRIAKPVILKSVCTILLLFLAVSGGCGKDEDASKALAHARSIFREVFDDFKLQNEQVTLELEEGKNTLLTFQEAIRTAQDKDAEFSKVYTKWKKIEREVKNLHEEFANLVRGADSFFSEIAEKANSITDNQLKTEQLQRINERKENYTIRLKQSRSKIDMLDDVNTKVRDTITALEINYSLDVLEEKLTETFREIDTMIESIMKELEELSRESESLITARFG